jgi:hypothetical protein
MYDGQFCDANKYLLDDGTLDIIVIVRNIC